MKASCLSGLLGECHTKINLLKCSALNNLMPFSLVAQGEKLNSFLAASEFRKVLRQERILLITSYFCPGNDWTWIYGTTVCSQM